jgi:hypothetical protein
MEMMMRSDEAQTWIDCADAAEVRLTASRAIFVKAVKAVHEASIAYLPPDGISKEEFISRVLEATDNTEIFNALKEIEDAEAEVARIRERSGQPA